MEKQIGKIERKKHGFGFGTFFLGILFGFLLFAGVLVGLGFFAYNNVSAQWVNDKFNANIDLGSDEVNKKTIKDFATNISGLLKNTDTYSLNNLESDFGVKISDKIMGLDIADLKSVPIKDMVDEAQKKFSNISAEELKDVMDLSDMNNILNKTNCYYYNSLDGKLYKFFDAEVYSNEVDYEYSVAEGVVTIKKQTFNIVSGRVNIELKYLPLTTALGDFMDTMGDKITLGELETDYGVKLPSYFDNVDRTTTINELEDEINALYLADFFGYTISGEKVYNGTDEITGIMAKLAKVKVQKLGTIKSDVIDNSTVAEIMGYYENGGVYYTDKDYLNKVTGIMRVAAGKKLNELSSIVEELLLTDIFTADELDTGVFKLLDEKDVAITLIPKTLEDEIKGSTMLELQNAGLIADSYDMTQMVDIDFDGNDDKQVGSMTLDEVVKLFFDLI